MEECRTIRYGKNDKCYQTATTANESSRQLQLDHEGPLEDHNGNKKNFGCNKRSVLKIFVGKNTQSTGRKLSTKFLRTYIDTQGIPESIRTDQFSGSKGKAMRKFRSENNIEKNLSTGGPPRLWIF